MLVVFEDNDRTRPVVAGGLWSQTIKPPAPEDAANSKVERAFLKSTSGVGVMAEEVITIEGREDFEIKVDGALRIEAAEIEFVSSGPINVEASSSMTLAGATIELNP